MFSLKIKGLEDEMSFLDCLFSEVMLDITPPKTNMILENLNFQQEITSSNGGISSQSC